VPPAPRRLRRVAERQGLALRKSRRRDPRAVDHDARFLVDEAGQVVFGAGKSGASLDEIEAWLNLPRGSRSAP
jgi:hypothetical protein